MYQKCLISCGGKTISLGNKIEGLEISSVVPEVDYGYVNLYVEFQL